VLPEKERNNNMAIYLDQNILSDLRARKRAHSEDFRTMYELISEKCIPIVYSYTHLDEIRNITKTEYQIEHIELLSEIGAFYLTPTQDVDTRSPWVIWNEYLEREQENKLNGSDDATLALESLGKKFAGISLGSSFSEVFDDLQNIALSLAMKAEEDLLQVTHEELEFEGANAEKIKTELAGLMEKALSQKQIVIPEDQELGPKVFREWLQKQGKEMNQISFEDVISTLDEVFENACGKKIDQLHFFDQTLSSQIARSYTLMNWAGYHADDFTKQKKGKDRFRASSYDLSHITQATICTHLVSSDVRLCQKAKACYTHLNVKTKVIFPQDMINGQF
jgi:hypothetical protein